MRIQRARNGQEVFNKVDGELYVLVQTGDSLSATKVDPETGELLPETAIELTEENAICFRLINDPNPEPVPEGYSIVDGKLSLNGAVATEHGEIRVKRIIGVLPGTLVLAVEPRNGKEDEMDLFIYEPGRDRFTKLLPSSIPDVTYMGESQDGIYVGYSCTHTEKAEDEDKQDVEKFDSAAVMFISGRRILTASVPRPIILDDGIIEVPMHGGEKEILIPFDKQVDEEGVVKEDNYGCISLFQSKGSIEYDRSYTTGGPVEATRCMLDDSLVLRNREILIANDICINNPMLKEAEGYNYLVDVTESRVDNCKVTTITLADKDYNVVKVIQKHTRDRGIAFSVEK